MIIVSSVAFNNAAIAFAVAAFTLFKAADNSNADETAR